MEGYETQVGIRCSDAQRSRWEEAAAADRRKLADWIRIQLDDCADRQLDKAAKRQKG